MRRQLASIKANIFGVETVFDAFASEVNNTSSPMILKGQFHQLSNDQSSDPHLLYAASANISRGQLLRSGPIDSPMRAQELNALLKYLEEKRIASIQLASCDNEFEAIRYQRYLFSKYSYSGQLNNSIAHINLSLPHFFGPVSSKEKHYGLSDSSYKLSRLQNVEGWLHYCRWIDQEFSFLLQSIALDDTLRFPLEASLKDFSHEMSSGLLNACWQQLEALILQLGDQEFSNIGEAAAPLLSYEQLIAAEKQALELRIELRSYLQLHDELLDAIIIKIDKIEKVHPELQQIKAVIQICKALLDVETDLSGFLKESTGKRLLLLTLLNSQLNVTPIYNCDTGLDRTSISFSISLALMQLLQTEKLSNVLNLVLDWDAYVLSTNKKITEMGHEAFVEWLKHAPDDQHFIGSARLIAKLRVRNLKNLQIFSAPLLPSGMNIDIGKDFVMEREYLNFLPDKYIEYDQATGHPIKTK